MSTTLSKDVLSKYKNDIFVETGTLWGEAIDIALELGFKKIYSTVTDFAKFLGLSMSKPFLSAE